jgi:type I restriction enzyme S subunit
MYPISTSTNLDTNYCFTILLGDRFTRFASAQSARTGIPKINREELLNFVFPLPTLTEQRAIATALSDVDRLMSAYDQLIAKKKAIKQGAMQELLTGKRRLEGFEGEWEVPTDIGDAKNISITSRQISLTGLKSIRSLPTNTLLVTCIASIGKNAILRKAGGCNQQINAVIPYDHHSVDFIYYLIENSKNYILGKAGMTATSIVSKKEFSSLEFLIPSSLEEQPPSPKSSPTWMPKSLPLEQQRDKYKAVKQGMMQELLTGKTRLI